MGKLPGITREEEEQRLQETIDVAQDKLERTKHDVTALAEQLHAMLEDFDESDKESQALWNNTDARFKEVSLEVNRATMARKKPYFGRIDFTDHSIGKKEVYYIGHSVIAKDPAHPLVIDWRAPVAGVYYDSSLGETSYSVKGEGKFEVLLTRKRTYEIEEDRLKDFYDSDVVANDELLTKYLAKNKRTVLNEIIATIQQEQNVVIRKKPQHNLLIQGAAGSGKTTVAMHRISYILYNYELEFAPQDFYIIGSNQVLLNYITGVLPQLNVYGVQQMTMEQLFVRLLYEDWDKKYRIKPVQRGVTPPIKGTGEWFRDLEQFCEKYEWDNIPHEDVRIAKNNVLLLSGKKIKQIISQNMHLSRADKISKLTEHLLSKLENEISGKYYSYTREEKLRLTHLYETYFGKREWKGSIFDMYDAFLMGQREKGHRVELPQGVFDLYDLAALAYLYKRLKETEIIREAGHVVIDEAQDFGMMAYYSMAYCLSKCTYTIMGDVSQNISMDYGLSDWTQLKQLMLPDPYDYFGLLQKSYRNTVEISDYATKILQHGSFQVYPVQPIIRHGDLVETCGASSYEELVSKTVETINKWKASGLETIAVICKDQNEQEKLCKDLAGRIEIQEADVEQMEFQAGVMVLPLEYTKGLEFDGVIIFDASTLNYPMEDGYVKRLYVAATRALHQLTVLYQGELTPIIANPVSESKLQEAVVQPEGLEGRIIEPEEEKTRAQIAKEIAKEGEVQMAERGTIGPKRIQASQKKETAPTSGRVKITGATSTLPSYLDRQKKSMESGIAKVNLGEFGEMPDNQSLYPPGHTRIDCSVRMIMKTKGYFDAISSYGTLRIQPIQDGLVRVCFAKGQGTDFGPVPKQWQYGSVSGKVREGKDGLEILTKKLMIRLDKKSGAISFLAPNGRLLLCERAKEPRQVGGTKAYTFFAWDKKESLLARTIRGEKELAVGRDVPIGMSAKYISYGEETEEFPCLFSDKGYELLFPKKRRTLCCNIPMYGTYVATEGKEVVEYYFRVP